MRALGVSLKNGINVDYVTSLDSIVTVRDKMSWKQEVIEVLEQKASNAYDNYYRSKISLGEHHSTTVGYKQWYLEAQKLVMEAKAEIL